MLGTGVGRVAGFRPSLDEVDTVIHPLGPPQGVGVVELDQVHAFAGVAVAAAVYLFVRVTPVSWDDLVGRGSVIILGA